MTYYDDNSTVGPPDWSKQIVPSPLPIAPSRITTSISVSSPPGFSWLNLGKYKREGKLLDGYPADFATFWSPRDNIHSLLKDLLQSAERSIVLNMFGYADPELDEIIRKKMENEHVYVQMSLDKTQAAGVHESDLLKLWPADAVGNSLAIGRSSKHAISHLKVLIVDGLYVAKGSTNWSASGESKQDNELSLSRHPVIAAETRTILDLGHSEMLRQMQRTK